MYGTSRALTEPTEPNQCNKCDSQRVHRPKAQDAIGHQGHHQDFDFAKSQCRSFRESERKKLMPFTQIPLKQQTMTLQIRGKTYPVRCNMLRLNDNKRIQKPALINLRPRQQRKQVFIRKKVLHEKDLTSNSYSNKNEQTRKKRLKRLSPKRLIL